MAHLPPEDLRFVLEKRALSDDAAVRSSCQTSLENFVWLILPFKLNYVLADIPFLAVGILAFCTFTFFALTRRLGMCVLFLTVASPMLTVRVVCLQSCTCRSLRHLSLPSSTSPKYCNGGGLTRTSGSTWTPFNRSSRRERLDTPSQTRFGFSSFGYSSRSHLKRSATPLTLARGFTVATGTLGDLSA